MFSGRKFSIPYSNVSDQQVSSMARAQIVTRTASPGQVIQVGDKVMAYGVTPQQAKMGDLDVKIRSFQQLSNEAQDVVRRNIQWQYGEQVGDVNKVEKGLLSRLLGLTHFGSGGTHFPEVPEKNRSELPPADLVKVGTGKPKRSAAPARPTSKTPAKAAPKTAAAPAPATAAPATSSEPTEATDVGKASATARMHLTTAFQTLARRHKAARQVDSWEVSRSYPSALLMTSTAKKDFTNEAETHELRYDPKTENYIHRHTKAGDAEPTEYHLNSPEELYKHVVSNNESWDF